MKRHFDTLLHITNQAGMAELVDAQDSKSCDRKVMRVRFSLPAPHKKPHEHGGFLCVSRPALLEGRGLRDSVHGREPNKPSETRSSPQTSA